MKNLLFMLIPAVFASCATISNTSHCYTEIRPHAPMTAIVDSDTIELNAGRSHNVALERSKNPKEIIFITDSGIDTVLLKPRWCGNYYMDFFTFGVGLLGDWNTPKKWKYPSIYLTDASVHNKYANKNALNLRVSFPYGNWFYSADENASKSDAGFGGISLGLDYHYSDKAFLNISGTGIMNFFIPFPAAVDYSGILDHMYSLYGSVSNNHMLNKKRFSIGYGISYGYDEWDTVNHGWWTENATKEERNQESIYRKSHSLGLVFPFYYYTKRSFYMGIVYRPMLLQFAGKTRFQYQHTASFDFGWRIRLNK